ncbi:MAG: hypothetical protein A2033_10840 [Bacteroidetes bacterium GWA2_31_9]|nr:MAG: hypothetical protein A2033_10840 [Bacteroidetes bacterium GWA2_31_9]
MLKAITNIIHSLLILVSSTGIAISKHYCKNEVKSVSIYLTAKACCKSPCKCCHNEIVTIKKTIEDYSFSTNSFNFDNYSIDFINVWQNLESILLPATFNSVVNIISPHNLLVSTYKFICVFRL